jgi:hypothetical protein
MSRTLRDIAFDTVLAEHKKANPTYVWGVNEEIDEAITDQLNDQANDLMETVPQWMKGCV